MRTAELEAHPRAMRCLETILAAFPNATVVSEEELDLIRQQAEIDEWNADK